MHIQRVIALVVVAVADVNSNQSLVFTTRDDCL